MYMKTKKYAKNFETIINSIIGYNSKTRYLYFTNTGGHVSDWLVCANQAEKLGQINPK